MAVPASLLHTPARLPRMRALIRWWWAVPLLALYAASWWLLTGAIESRQVATLTASTTAAEQHTDEALPLVSATAPGDAGLRLLLQGAQRDAARLALDLDGADLESRLPGSRGELLARIAEIALAADPIAATPTPVEAVALLAALDATLSDVNDVLTHRSEALAGGLLRASILAAGALGALSVALAIAHGRRWGDGAGGQASDEGLLRLLARDVPQLVFEIDPDGNLTFVSDRSSQLLGVPAASMLGLPLETWVLDANAIPRPPRPDEPTSTDARIARGHWRTGALATGAPRSSRPRSRGRRTGGGTASCATSPRSSASNVRSARVKLVSRA